MAFLSRIGKSKLSHFSHHFKTNNHGYLLLNHSISRAKPCLAENLHQPLHYNRPDFRFGVRFFAAPIQFVKEKKEPVATRINEEITAEVVRLVNGDEHSVVTLREALFRAKELELDLVEVSPDAKPPVCKLLDYKKEKFAKGIKEKEISKSKGAAGLRPGAPKEIKFSVKTEKKDLEMKAIKITKLMEDGYKVKCVTKGAESAVLQTLSRLCSLIGEVAVVESGPSMGKSSAFMVVRHIKYGQKKGSVKKLKDIVDENTGVLVVAPASESNEESDTEVDKQSSDDQSKTRDGKVAEIRASKKARPDRNSSRPNTGTSGGPNTDTSGGGENRYGVREQVKDLFFQSAKGVDNRNQSKRDGPPMKSEPRFSNQGRQSPRDDRPPRGVEARPEANQEQNRYATKRPGEPPGRSRQEGEFGGFSR